MVAASVLLAADPWYSVASLRRALPSDGRLVGHWRRGDAAFAAVSTAKGIASVVRIDEGRTEVRHSGETVETDAQATRIRSLDLTGVRIGDTVVLFHMEDRMARSAVSFDTGGGSGRVRFIVTGLAPGMWEIWRNGWLVEPEAPVRAPEGVLYFEERPGSYFLRRLS